MSISRNGFELFRGTSTLVSFILILYCFGDQLAMGVNGNVVGCGNCRPDDCINQGPGIYPQYKCLTSVKTDLESTLPTASTIQNHVDTGSSGFTSVETLVLLTFDIIQLGGTVLMLTAVFYVIKGIQQLQKDNGKLAEQLSMVQKEVERIKEPRTQARTQHRIRGTRDYHNFGNQEEAQPMINHHQTAQLQNVNPAE
ncbi:uncharacterized protein [Ptychodera flava]|uniref:uncharacterized protein n=1 Tax=Ptychodera flava TaxID=63121 RepID=UPI00396AAA1F